MYVLNDVILTRQNIFQNEEGGGAAAATGSSSKLSPPARGGAAAAAPLALAPTQVRRQGAGRGGGHRLDSDEGTPAGGAEAAAEEQRPRGSGAALEGLPLRRERTKKQLAPGGRKPQRPTVTYD